MVEDEEGNIWVGTQNNGISVFNPLTESFKRIQKQQEGNSITDHAITKLLIKKEFVFIGTLSNGLTILNTETGKFSHFKHSAEEANTLSNNKVLDIIDGNENSVWVSTNSGSLDLFELQNRNFQRFTYNSSYNRNMNLKPLLKDSDGLIWVGTQFNGIFKFDTKTQNFTHVSTASESRLKTNIITCLNQSSSGDIWIGTDGTGIHIYNSENNSFSYIESNPYIKGGLASNVILDIYEDSTNTTWISTLRGGVQLYNSYMSKFSKYQKIPETNSLSFNSVITMYEATDGKIWMGTDGGGLNIFDPKTKTFTYSLNGSNAKISSNVIKSILEDKNGNFWLGTYSGGLNVFNPKNNRLKNYLKNDHDSKSLGDNNVWCIYEDSFGDIYLGYLNGFAKYIPETDSFENFYADPNNPKGLNDNRVIELFEDKNQNLWLGTINGGLNIFDRKTKEFTHFLNDPTNPNSLPSNEIRTITEDHNGTLWIGTAQGICYLEKEGMKFIQPEATKTLPNQVINGILEDNEGDLWISTNRGLSKFNPTENTVINYGIDDGLQGLNFNYNASLKSEFTNEMYFGGVNGFNVFTPKKVLPNPNQPKSILTGFKVYDKEIGINDLVNDHIILNQSINSTKEITLTYEENIFSLTFASLDYTAPERNQYAYRLVKFDTTWNYQSGLNNKVTYMNLTPKTYEFEIKSSNNDGGWSDTPQRLTIKIRPPWWETTLFRVLLGVFLVVLVFTFIRYRTVQLKRQNQLLESKVTERTKQLQSSQDKIVEQNKNLQEKQSEILTQNEELKQTQEELQAQRDYIEDKNRELQKVNENIKLSISTAEEIQKAVLPPVNILSQYFKEHFVIYKPKDIVSGDFYWITPLEDDLWIIAADCTGHGVPGAFMTLLGKNFFDKLIKQDRVQLPSKVLEELDREIIASLNQEQTAGRRGMDLVVLKFENYLKQEKKLQFAGAKNSIYVVDKDQELQEYRGDRMEIGGFKTKQIKFEDYLIDLSEGATIYLGSDGYQDQNNFKRKSFTKKRLRDLLASIADQPLSQQQESLEEALSQHMVNTVQRDDILLMGIKV